jgi:hypothetical protein
MGCFLIASITETISPQSIFRYNGKVFHMHFFFGDNGLTYQLLRMNGLAKAISLKDKFSPNVHRLPFVRPQRRLSLR